jgi:hypothetical protein
MQPLHLHQIMSIKFITNIIVQTIAETSDNRPTEKGIKREATGRGEKKISGKMSVVHLRQ